MSESDFEGFELSPQQKHLWLLQQGEPSPYLVQAAWWAEGPLDTEQLGQALAALVGRYEILRTTFRSVPGLALPLQVVAETSDITLRREVFETADSGPEEEWIRELFAAAHQAPFDLEKGPLLDARLAVFRPRRHLLVLSLPALCADSLTLDLLFADLARFYAVGANAFAAEDEPLQYADLAAWQENLLESEEASAGRAHWRKWKLVGLGKYAIPFEKAPSASVPFGPQSIASRLDESMVSGLDDLCRELGLGFGTPYLAAWHTLLRWSLGNNPFDFGLHFDGRGFEELATAVGPLARFLPVQVGGGDGESFLELMQLAEVAREVGAAHQEAFSWKTLGTDAWQSELGEPFWHFGFWYEPSRSPREGEVRFSFSRRRCWIDRHQLLLKVRSTDGGVELELCWDGACHQTWMVQRLLSQLRTLLDHALAKPRQPVEQLCLLSAAERHQALVELNDTASDLATEPRLERYVEAQAERTPEAIALTWGAVQLSYGEVDRRANRLACRLVRQGVGVEDRVAVCLERCPEMVIAFLGVLKAGAAYVPLDPGYPSDRLTFMLEDSRAILLLSSRQIAAKLPQPGIQFLWVEDLMGASEGSAGIVEVASGGQQDSAHTAYSIYTSGSTGRPKGVLIPHAAICNRLLWMQRCFPLGPTDRLLQKTPAIFDASIWEIFLPLWSGARLILARHGGHADSAYLAREVQDQGVTVLQLVPTMLEVFLNEPEAVRDSPLRLLFAGGEVLSREIRDHCHAQLEARLVNLYGPTEVSIDATYHSCARRAGGRVPIGRPLDNVQVYLLDKNLRPVAAGMEGEIFVGGAGLARGYLFRPSLSAERFVPSPFGQLAGARFYRTGDLGRRWVNGELEYVGRVDQQIKLRGYRIELGEIEATLASLDGVWQAAVVLRHDTLRHPRLVAYLVAVAEPPTLQTEELRLVLAQRLPEHMVPAVLIILDSLPLLPSGKLDRHALPDPETVRETIPLVPARNPVEERLVEIWSEVLGHPVGIEHNFFEEGGDSIMGIQVTSRARLAGYQFTAGQLFRFPTIGSLAPTVETGPVEIGPRAAPREAGLTPIQLDFFERDLADFHHYNQSLLLEVLEPTRPEHLDRLVFHLLEHHHALRLRFEQAPSGAWQQRLIATDEATSVAWCDLSALDAKARTPAQEKAADCLQRSLDPKRGRLSRVVYFDHGPERSGRLLLVFHHLAVDGFSWRILMEDLEMGHRQLREGRALALPSAASYLEWAARLPEVVPDLHWQFEKWSSAAAGSSLPRDFVAPSASERQTSTRWLDAKTTGRLLEDVPRSRTEVKEVLLAALALSMAAWSGQRFLRLDLEGHGREPLFPDLDIARIVGWFTSVFPVVFDLGAVVSPGEVLKRVKETLRQVPDRGVGYGLLRYLAEETSVREALSQQPAAEVIFNYLGRFDQEVATDSVFSVAPESAGADQSERQAAGYLLNFNAVVLQDRLRLNLTYLPQALRRDTVEAILEGYLEALRALVEHCCSAQGVGYIPSDFPLAGLDQVALDRLIGSDLDIEDIYPLAPLQEGLLVQSLRLSKAGSYFRQLSLSLDGELDAGALKYAWEQVLARHAVLRTEFRWQGLDRPLQVVRSAPELPFERLDWNGLTATEQEKRWQDLLAEDRHRAFDLSHAPLLRLSLIERGDRQYYFLWSFHHVLLDGWSMPLLWQEVFAAYQARRDSRLLEWPAVHPYRNFILWLEEQKLADAERFWRDKLAGFTAPTTLATGPLEGDLEADDSIESHLWLPAALSQELDALARRHKITLNTLVQSTWAMVLGHWSGARDVVFGVVSSGRPTAIPGVETMLGLFVNTLPIRVELDHDLPLAEFWQHFQQDQAEVRDYEFTPLQRIHRWSELSGNQTLFESIYAFENYPVDEAVTETASGDDGAWEIDQVAFLERTEYPLTLIVSPGDALHVKFLHDPRRFDATTVRRWGNHFRQLFESLVTNPEGQLGDLELWAPAQRHQILTEWNDSAQPGPLPGTLHGRFEEWVRRAPDAVAVTCGGEELSYAELDRVANRIAHRLRGAGAGCGTLVAVALSRSLVSVPALLGILKAGGTYVPLDASFPPARVQWILSRFSVTYLVTESNRLEVLRPNLPAELAHIVEVDRVEDAVAPPPPASASEVDLAYVIFTSGSTGTPKGVMVRHRPVLNLIDWVNATFAVGPSDRLLFTASLSFDLSVYDIFGMLAAGGSIHVVCDDELREPRQLAALLGREEITFWDSAPAALQQLVPFFPTAPAWSAGLRLVFASGDWIPVGLPDAVRRAFPKARFIGLGGATEATVWSNFFPVQAVHPRWPSIPYGRPIRNARYHVLDRRFSPCPIGVDGDLLIGGDCLASGYAREPSLTAEKFVPDPFCERPGARLYRTGDRARFGTDGLLEFLGRLDHQVKIRGFRIELGEIETHLARHPALAEVLVLARAEAAGEADSRSKRLVAYLVLRPKALAPGVSELREFLGERVPDYMVPAIFITLDEFPLTANGKLDRLALPAPSGGRPELSDAYAAPRSDAEKILAEIWSDLLGVDRIGIHDAFLELGGDSILSLQVVARAARVGLRITPRQLYESPTIVELAAVVGSTEAVRAEQGLVAGSVPLSPVQIAFFELGLAEEHHFNQALMLATERHLEAPPLAAALKDLLEHHDALRLRFARRGGVSVQEMVPPGDPVPCHVVDLSAIPPARWPAAMVAGANLLQASLDLAAGPLLRLAVFRSPAAEADRLLLVAHHLVVDGVSWRILLQDLEEAYEARAAGRAPELPAKTTSFKRWAEALEEDARSGRLDSEPNPWATLPEPRPQLLPVDFSQGENLVASGGNIEVAVDAVRTRILLRELSAVYRTEINDILLAALTRAFERWTGEPLLLVDLESHGRAEEIAPDLDLSRTVGWFTSIYPVLLDLRSASGSGEVIQTVKEQLRAIPVPSQDYGARRYLHSTGGGDPAWSSAEVGFNYLGQIDQAVAEESSFRLAPEVPGYSTSRRQQRRHLIEINGVVHGEVLRFTWAFSTAVHQRETVTALAEGFIEELAELIDHCRTPEAGGLTPSDLPLASLTAPALHSAVQMVAAKDGVSAPRAARQIEDILPLSPLQASMLLHNLALPDSRASFEQLVVRLEGKLDASVFEQVWCQILARHTTLRTSFLFDRLSEPLQVVRRRVELPLEMLDWRGTPTQQQEQRLLTHLEEERRQGFDLALAPLMRLALIRVGAKEWFFVWHHHHLILDGWCRNQVLREVMVLYRAGLGGEAPAQAPARPFRDYVAWLRDQDLGAAEDFWRQHLEGWKGSCSLRLGAAPVAAEEFGPASRRRLLGADPTAALDTLARRHQLTLSTLLRGAWAMVLAGFSGQNDVVFGATVSGRPADLTGAENILGMLINNLPMRVAMPPDQQVLAWLRDLQSTQLELQQVEWASLEQIHQWSGIPLGRRLFDTLLVFQNLPALGRAAEDGEDAAARSGVDSAALNLQLEYASLETGYLLTLVATPGREFGLELSYPRQRVHAVAAEALLDHLIAVLQAIASGASGAPVTLGELPTPKTVFAVEPELTIGAGGEEGDPVAPRNTLELELKHIWEDSFGIRPIGVRDNFFALGGHSMLAVRLIGRTRRHFGGELPLTALFEGDGTIESLASVLWRYNESLPWSPLVGLQTEGSKPPLFLVHPAAGSVLGYADLVRHLGDDQPVYALQPRGERRNQAPIAGIEEMAELYLEAVREAHPDGPYLLGGWSFGGHVAFEMARLLSAQGEEVALLVMLDTKVWTDAKEPDPAEHLAAWAGEQIPGETGAMPDGGLDDQLSWVRRRLIAQGRLPEDFELDDARRFFDLYMTHMKAVHRYRPQPFAEPIAVFHTTDGDGDPSLGWRKLTSGEVSTFAVAGDHVSFLSDPHVGKLATMLRVQIDLSGKNPHKNSNSIGGGKLGNLS